MRTRLEVGAAQGLTPFIGRERELAMLHACFARAQAGQGQMVFLVGDPGIGKSRLLLEFRQQLGMQADWLEGHALSFGHAMAFHPIIDLLKRNFRIEPGDTEGTILSKIDRGVAELGAALQPLLPHLRSLLGVDPGDAAMRTMDPKLRRAGLFEALRRLLLRAAEVRPQVVVFEDLHWMDSATEEFLVLMADSMPTSCSLCLCTYRPDYTHPFGERTYHTRMALATLSAQESVQMAQTLLDATQLPEALQTLINQKTEGNPFFIEEVIKSLCEAEIIQRVEGHYELTRGIEEIEVPDTIQDLLLARMDRLDETPKHMLQLAAVIGREFPRGLLERLADHPEGVDRSLHALKTVELIYEKQRFPELTYIFKHALTQEVAYHSLLASRRRALHGLIGQTVEDLHADRLHEHYDMLAHHFVRGEVWPKALDYLCKAAEKAAQAFAVREALALYAQALDVITHLGQAADPQRVMDIYQARAALAFVMSDFTQSRFEADRLLALSRAQGEVVREGAALASIAWASTWARDLEYAIASARQAIAVAEPIGARSVLARSHFVIGFVRAVTGQHADAEFEIGRAMTISRDAGDVVHRSLALSTAGLLKNWSGDYAAASQLQSEALDLARAHNLLLPLLFSYFLYGITLTGQGRYDEAFTLFQEGLALAERVGDEAIHHRLLNCLGWLYSELGDVERALDLNRRSAEVGRKRNDPGTIPNAELNLGEVFLAQGDLALAQTFFEAIHRYALDPTSSAWMKDQYSIRLYANLGQLWLARGDPNKAEPFVAQSLQLAAASRARKNIVKGWRLKGEIAMHRRKWGDAERWLRQALSLAQEVGNPPQLWKTHRALGHLYVAREQPERARRAYQAARDVVDRLNTSLQTPALRTCLAQSPLMQSVDQDGHA